LGISFPVIKAKVLKQLQAESADFRSSNSRIIKMRKASKYSKGELKVAEVLKDNGVEFYTEYFFTELKILGKQKALFFDFFCPDYNLCIEFDGEQHYTEKFNGRKQENIKRYDFYKTTFCVKKGIHLLRIKYSDYDNIELLICNKFDKISPLSGI
jgi:very-short-patch-repair endonuclease